MKCIITIVLLFLLYEAVSQNEGFHYETEKVRNRNFYILPSGLLPEIEVSQDLGGRTCGAYCYDKKVPNFIPQNDNSLELIGSRTIARDSITMSIFLRNLDESTATLQSIRIDILDTLEMHNTSNRLGTWDYGPKQANRVIVIDLSDPNTHNQTVGSYLGNTQFPRDNGYDIIVFNNSRNYNEKLYLLKFRLYVTLDSTNSLELQSDDDYYIVIEM